jgi:hypothetical protein
MTRFKEVNYIIPVADTDAPTVLIEKADGSRVHWRADMCRVADLEPEAVAELFPGREPCGSAALYKEIK